MADIENEVRAVAKLCIPGAHRNVVAVLRHGKLVDSPSYYLDMELCDYNLENHMKGGWKYMSILKKWAAVVKITSDLANGIAFIHDHKEIHRDLKPRNGN